MPAPYDPDHHHRRSIRLPGYDYRQAGGYFITIITFERACILSTITDDTVTLSDYGKIVQSRWQAIPAHHPHTQSGLYVIMPNHIHGILWITDNTLKKPDTPQPAGHLLSGSLAAIVRSFKASVTKAINELRGTPGAKVWQRNYYERIIRDDRELLNIRDYIQNNPLKWSSDRENPDNPNS